MNADAEVAAPGYLWPRWLFLRALGLIFLSAFYSFAFQIHGLIGDCLLYTSPSPRDGLLSRMPSSA